MDSGYACPSVSGRRLRWRLRLPRHVVEASAWARLAVGPIIHMRPMEPKHLLRHGPGPLSGPSSSFVFHASDASRRASRRAAMRRNDAGPSLPALAHWLRRSRTGVERDCCPRFGMIRSSFAGSLLPVSHEEMFHAAS